MKKSPEKIRRYYGVFVFGLVAVFLVSGYVWMMVLATRYHADVLSTQEELLSQVERERRVRDTAGVLASFKKEREQITTVFKTPNDVISIIEEIEGFGTLVKAPVSVLQVEIEGEDKVTREGTFVVSVMSKGSWQEMTHLLSLLDSLPYHAVVNQVTFDTSANTDQKNVPVVWTLRLSLAILLKN